MSASMETMLELWASSRTQEVWSSEMRPDIAGTAENVAAALDPAVRQRLSAGAGTKGPRVYDWAYVELGGPGSSGYHWRIR